MDWNSAESQELRFIQLLKVLESFSGFTLNDYGCGYGAMVPVLEDLCTDFRYRGYDVSAAMLDHARHAYERPPHVTFSQEAEQLDRADYTVASGVFNVRLDVPVEEWKRYVTSTIDLLASRSTRGFSFNMLTSYSDPEKMRPDLYYGDPRAYFDLCKQYARNVALLHDYGLYEFTMIVRHDA